MISKKTVSFPKQTIAFNRHLSIDEIILEINSNPQKYPRLKAKKISLSIDGQQTHCLLLGESHRARPSEISLGHRILLSFELVAFESFGLFRATKIQQRYTKNLSPMISAERKYYKQETNTHSPYSFYLLPLERTDPINIPAPDLFEEDPFCSRSEHSSAPSFSNYDFMKYRNQEMAKALKCYLASHSINNSLILVGSDHISGLLDELNKLNMLTANA